MLGKTAGEAGSDSEGEGKGEGEGEGKGDDDVEGGSERGDGDECRRVDAFNCIFGKSYACADCIHPCATTEQESPTVAAAAAA